MAITLRSTKGSELTHSELDANFTDLDERVTQASTAASSPVDSTARSAADANAGEIVSLKKRITDLEDAAVDTAKTIADLVAAVEALTP